MKKFLFILFFLVFAYPGSGQSLNTFYQGIVNGVSYDSVFHHLQSFQVLGNKTPGSASLTNTRNWLTAKYSAYGYPSVALDTFTYLTNTLYNVVVTKTGTLFPNKYLVVSAHYDTKNGTGTNDNGSGVAILLETARLLSDVATGYSVIFIDFSAEENGLIGSTHYVNHSVTGGGMDILLEFNIDEVGGVAGMTNNTVRCEKDLSSPSSNNAASALYTDTLATLTHLYSPLYTAITNAYGSDYVPFQSAGKIITGFYEDNESSYVHTSQDNLAHLDTSYVYQLAKATVGAVLYFAKAYDQTTGEIQTGWEAREINIFPNPFTEGFTVTNSSDKPYLAQLWGYDGCLYYSAVVPPEGNILISPVSGAPSLYLLRITTMEGRLVTTQKLIRK